MPKAPIILPIARSRLWGGLHSGLLLGLALMCLATMGWLTAAMVIGVGGGCLWRSVRCLPRGTLYLLPRAEGPLGRWLLPQGELDASLVVSCDYLTPWLVGLKVGQQRVWLWPDSVPREAHRAVRRLFHSPGR
ncbi:MULTISPECIES: hypothetical protein [Halomonadaceae]|jgi:toxin CptA|uniref:Toxin CptA n=1 Tax=Vreelandella janggokensis TaxID=370767 RepID=A0ABT4IPB5_9GAMM|nr:MULTISPECIES: hypothetical protein [Halomonas]MCZ0925509.1 hypothetical protein [Halomonas janggokensis]MCZ0931504.1 hypothetical protein [Halomonas janggokensis]MDR5886980.1 hypothetical protein [Halomonas janggokensis]QPL47448.1 hypothetical protein IT895_06710 [Halomonas sp. A40-4]